MYCSCGQEPQISIAHVNGNIRKEVNVHIVKCIVSCCKNGQKVYTHIIPCEYTNVPSVDSNHVYSRCVGGSPDNQVFIRDENWRMGTQRWIPKRQEEIPAHFPRNIDLHPASLSPRGSGKQKEDGKDYGRAQRSYAEVVTVQKNPKKVQQLKEKTSSQWKDTVKPGKSLDTHRKDVESKRSRRVTWKDQETQKSHKKSKDPKTPWWARMPLMKVDPKAQSKPGAKSSAPGRVGEAKRAHKNEQGTPEAPRSLEVRKVQKPHQQGNWKGGNTGNRGKIAPATPLTRKQRARMRVQQESKPSVPSRKEASKMEPAPSEIRHSWQKPSKRKTSWWKRDSPTRDPRLVAPAFLPKPGRFSRLVGGGDPEESEPEIVIKKLEMKTTDDPLTVTCKMVHPSKALFRCYAEGCTASSRGGYGAEDLKYLTRHIRDAHGMKVQWAYTCGKCRKSTKEFGVKATNWLKTHLSLQHGIQAEHRFKVGKGLKMTTAEILEKTAPSLSNPKRIMKPVNMMNRQMTPEKLEGMIQTRSVVKTLSVLKESSKKIDDSKEDEAKKDAPKQQPRIAGIFKPTARRSLANMVVPGKAVNDSTGRPSIAKEDLKDLSASERVKKVRELSSKQARLSVQGRLSLQPSKPRPSIVPGSMDRKEDLLVMETKEKMNDDSSSEEETLDKTFGIEDWEPKVKRFNTWCLDHETSKEAWLGDEVLKWYTDWLCSNHKEFKPIDPMWWEMYKREGIMYIKQKIISTVTYLFPICEDDHWILVVFNSSSIWYANTLGYEPRGRVKRFMEEMNRTREWFEVPVPEQKDGWNCGVHVCLMAKSIATNHYWYGEEEVRGFRTAMKQMLKEKRYELYSEPPNRPSVSKTPVNRDAVNSDDSDILEIPPDTPISDDTSPKKDVLEKMQKSEPKSVEKTSEESSTSALPKLMEAVVSPPPVLTPKSDPIDPKCQKSKREEASGQREKQRKVPEGKPDELVLKVREWFQSQFKSYEEEGRSFQRLEWLTSALTAAIQKASAGDEQTVEKIEKRCPPPELQEGEMATQTEIKKRPRVKREAKTPDDDQSIMKSYWENRSKTYNKIIGKEAKQCEIPVRKLEEFFTKTTAVTNVPKEILDKVTSRLPEVDVGKWIEDPFTSKEVAAALKKTKDTAPGVDGLRYHHLNWFDPDCKLMTKVFNECRRHRKIPAHWKEAETILLYKGGDESKPDNWRPISLMPTIYKLYSSLWNRRIRSVGGVMSKCQRGFQEREGCNESIGILRSAIDIAKGMRKHLSVAWLDLTNAFGSVPHELIESTLVAYGFPDMVVSVIRDMYRGASIRVKNRSEKTDPIQIKSGVKQGDPISPTLFNMCLENVIRKHLSESSGHHCLSSNIKLLAFADDMAILAGSKEQLQRELDAMDEQCTPLNLIFKPAKCASLVIEFGKIRQHAELKLKGQPIRNLSEKDSYKYLGVQTGIDSRISEMDLIKSVIKDVDTVNRSGLAPPQKLDCLKTFVLPKMTYMYANSIPKITELKVFANMVMRGVKIIHRIPVKGSPLEYIQLPVGKGGLGVACPKITAMTTFLVSTLKKLWSDDPYIRRLYREYLTVVVQYELGKKKEEVTIQDIASYLSNELPSKKDAFGYNCYSRVKEVCRGLSQNQDSPLHTLKFTVVNHNLALLVQATEASSKKIYTEIDIKRLQKNLKNQLLAAQLHRFMVEKPVKSQIVQVIQQYPQSNSFVRTGGKVSIACHNFVHRARLNMLACNFNTYDKSKSKSCRRCGYMIESQMHILQNCTYGMSNLVTARHDAVLHTVKNMIEKGGKKDWKMKIDEEFPGYTRLRPDIFLQSPDKKEVILADVSVPYENGIEAMQASWNRKVEKYEEGFQHLKDQGIKLTVLPIIIGSLGTWWAPTTDSLVELGISKAAVRKAIPELCSTVLEHSKNIYWKHIFGDAYKQVPIRYGFEKPEGNQWKKERNPLPEALED
ncbi:hypothetical protein B9Z55_028813 [Caenorhabditis nigoni]|uniref:Reverse transcriptase domain-containing protein n=1 Tax=Caenorhabditis nigoni TaxID=1611254 RepID=A0A2G5SAE2_9PELO|nr:hypothetical protein B9Z55_028813 [Caenorhabditis nigoni]